LTKLEHNGILRRDIFKLVQVSFIILVFVCFRSVTSGLRRPSLACAMGHAAAFIVNAGHGGESMAAPSLIRSFAPNHQHRARGRTGHKNRFSSMSLWALVARTLTTVLFSRFYTTFTLIQTYLSNGTQYFHMKNIKSSTKTSSLKVRLSVFCSFW